LPARISADDVGIGSAAALGAPSEFAVFACAILSEIGTGGGGAGLVGRGTPKGEKGAVRGASLRFELTAGRAFVLRELEVVGPAID
jgi:hypothetical protein